MAADAQQKVMAITGGASGIGLATAQLLSRQGAQLVLVDVARDVLSAAAESLPDGAATFCVDITDPDAVDAAFAEIETSYGHLDALVHTAGRATQAEIKDRVAKHYEQQELTGQNAPLDVTTNISNDQWRELLGINLDGAFYCIRAALRIMQPRGAGAIVTVSSHSAIEASRYAPHYAASKAGLKALTSSIAKEVIGFGIRVNCVAPGPVATPMWFRNPTAIRERFNTPIGRPAAAAELADVISFLLSDDASYIVGETVNVNGGLITP